MDPGNSEKATLLSYLNSPKYLEHRARSRRTARKNDERLWSDEVEAAFHEALREFPPWNRKNDSKAKNRRNGLISMHIQERTGKIRTQQQISSRLRKLNAILQGNPDWESVMHAQPSGRKISKSQPTSPQLKGCSDDILHDSIPSQSIGGDSFLSFASEPLNFPAFDYQPAPDYSQDLAHLFHLSPDFYNTVDSGYPPHFYAGTPVPTLDTGITSGFLPSTSIHDYASQGLWNTNQESDRITTPSQNLAAKNVSGFANSLVPGNGAYNQEPLEHSIGTTSVSYINAILNPGRRPAFMIEGHSLAPKNSHIEASDEVVMIDQDRQSTAPGGNEPLLGPGEPTIVMFNASGLPIDHSSGDLNSSQIQTDGISAINDDTTSPSYATLELGAGSTTGVGQNHKEDIPQSPTINNTFTDSGYSSTLFGGSKQLKSSQEGPTAVESEDNQDTKSIYSDISSVAGAAKGYMIELAEELVRTVNPYRPDQDMIQRLFEALPELLRAFSLSLGNSGSCQMHRDAMVFIHKYRRGIAATFRERLLDHEIEDSEYGDSRDNHDATKMSLDDIMSLWQEKDQPHDDGVPEPTSHHVTEEFDHDDSEDDEVADENELPGLTAYRQIIRNSPAYTWLLGSIQRECVISPPEPNIVQEIRDSITEFLPMSARITRRKPAEIFDVSFRVHWDPVRFLIEQEYPNDIPDAIERVITLTGSRESAQALTCRDYMKLVWPGTGVEILRLVNALVSGQNTPNGVLADGTRVAFSMQPSVNQESFDVWVDVQGTRPIIAEIGEQMAWLASALRSSPFEQKVSYSEPFLQNMRISHVTYERNDPKVTYLFEIGVNVDEGPDPPSGVVNGECWHDLFGSPVVVQGYPIRRRPEAHARGLEMPLNIMAALAEARKAIYFDGKIILKGFSTMLVPTKCGEGAVTWHLVHSEDGNRVSYLKSTEFATIDISIKQLEGYRHILGWCPEMKLYAGAADMSYNTRSSALTRPPERSILANALLSTGYIVTATSSFIMGRKDIKVRRNTYIGKMKWISQKYVALWDVDEKRGWLINGASALLHLIRASLHQDRLESKFSSLCIFKDNDFQEATQAHRPDSCLEFLLNSNNLKVRIYPEEDGYITFKDRVEDFYDFLEQTIDYQVKGISDGNSYGDPRSILDGWDFTDLSMERDPIYPRRMILDGAGLSWIDLTRSIHAVTLFGKGFGDIIVPTKSLCSPWAKLPSGRSYLAASVADLQNIMNVHGDPYSHPIKLTHDILWCAVKETLPQCACNGKKNATHSDLTQVLLPSSMRRELSHGIAICPQTSGAVILGFNSNNPWFWGDSGLPSRQLDPTMSVPLIRETHELTSTDSGIGRSLGSSSPKLAETTPDSDPYASTDEEAYKPMNPDSSERRRSWGTGNTSPSAYDYKIGIVCALHIELMAVRALFDRVFEEVRIANEDPNYYALGSIGRHNITAVCLPHGTYGTNSAANVASNMKRSFPALKFCLLVGIGGGVPSPSNDIRLGDVVVSTPSGRYSGVLPYDMIKSLESGASQLNGYLCPPPEHIMCAISALESDPEISSTPLREYLLQITQCKPQYSHPSIPDILFSSDYSHNGAHDSCDECDPRRQVPRITRISADPQIHYGLIASGNQVMKSAEKRDRLSREHNVLCFEMEGAGIMNSFPCLVIRGVCDYADSHKNKKWQSYAAATAAAYAKLLLTRLRALEDSPPLSDRSGHHRGSRKRRFSGDLGGSPRVKRRHS